jgi:pimeloyl-ACP methyl ester carboxylesterase
VAQPVTSELEVRGTAIKVMRAGSGEPLLILRGTDASDTWRPWMDRLAAHFDVIVPEHPGFGGRPMPPWLDRVGDLGHFYLDVVDALGLERAHLLGTSLGGWIAADMAHHASRALCSVTLVGAAGIRLPDVDGVDIFLRTEGDGLRDRFHDQKCAEAVIARMLRPETEDVRLANAIAVARVAWSPRLHDPQLQKWLHRIAAPTLIVWGEEDRVFPTAYAAAFQNGIPGARLALVPACGHWVAHEKPDALVDAIMDFVRARGGTA